MDKQYLTDREVSEMTGIGLQTLRNQRSMMQGIPYIKLRRSVRYRLLDVIQYMDTRRIKTGIMKE